MTSGPHQHCSQGNRHGGLARQLREEMSNLVCHVQQHSLSHIHKYNTPASRLIPAGFKHPYEYSHQNDVEKEVEVTMPFTARYVTQDNLPIPNRLFRNVSQQPWLHTPCCTHGCHTCRTCLGYGVRRYQTQADIICSDILKIIIAIFLPPVGVLLERGFGSDFCINILLTILGYIPGIIHALYALPIIRPSYQLY